MWQRGLRFIKHRWAPDATQVFGAHAVQAITEAVAQSEAQHSGEIRICIESGLPTSYLLRDAPTAALIRERALAQFGKLRVWDTEHNNGVLIYLLLAEHAIEIVADRGLTPLVPPQAWQAVVGRLAEALRAGQAAHGVRSALAEVTALLAPHFPLRAGHANPNELPNTPALQ